jgi:hypothetical protein
MTKALSKDQLIQVYKTALEMACHVLVSYQGVDSPLVNPECWLQRAYLSLHSEVWEKLAGGKK